VPSIARKGWHRVRSSVAGEVTPRVGAEVDRVETHLIEAIDRLQASIDRLQSVADALAGSLAVMRREMADLQDTVAVQSDVQAQTTELFGRLIQSASNRLDEIEAPLAAAKPHVDG